MRASETSENLSIEFDTSYNSLTNMNWSW
jgi:hypothetical protein